MDATSQPRGIHPGNARLFHTRNDNDHTNTLRRKLMITSFLSFFPPKALFIYLFLERGEGREKERERNISVWLPLTRPPMGTWPATQACALTGNRTRDSLVHRPALSPLSHTIQGDLPISRGERGRPVLEGRVDKALTLTQLAAVCSVPICKCFSNSSGSTCFKSTSIF